VDEYNTTELKASGYSKSFMQYMERADVRSLLEVVQRTPHTAICYVGDSLIKGNSLYPSPDAMIGIIDTRQTIRARGHSGFPLGLISDSNFQNGGLNERATVCGIGRLVAAA